MAVSDLVNQTLGQFHIRREIGRGGMAVVYEAYQPALQRNVALKVLPPQFAHDQAFIERFRHEAIAAAKLHHPNIISIYDVGQTGDLNYIVMELLEGTVLSSLIRQGPVPPARVSKIIEQVASALDYAHQQGFIHRDIKPSNIMVGRNDHVTLMDFGIAKALTGARLTQTGMVVGTPEYMSPEQVTGEELDHRTDVYALGIVAYEMLTGQAPFTGTTASVLYKQAHEPPPPLRAHVPGLSPAIENVILRALAKRREERYATAGQFAQSLTAAVAGRAVAPPPTTRPTARAPQPRSSMNWLPWAIGGGAVVLMLCAVIAAVIAIGSAGRPPSPTATLPATPFTQIAHATQTMPSFQSTPVNTPIPPSPVSLPTASPPSKPAYGWPVLAYASGARGVWKIMLLDLTTGQARPLPNQPANSGVPAWSRDHKRLAFRSQASGSWQIYIINADGTDLRQVTRRGNNYEPNWSPDGTQLVFVSDRDGNKELYVVNINTGQETRLTQNNLLDDDPNWSPDGSQIVFERRDNNCYNIYVIRPDGSAERALTSYSDSECNWASTPAWSPDGQWIAYEQSFMGQGYRLKVMAADGSSARWVTRGGAEGVNDVRPAWSPDGKWIAFSSDRSGDDGIYIIPADGGDMQRVDTTGGFDPAW